MAFRFSLAAVLLVRRERESAAERALGVAERELAEMRGQLAAIQAELHRLAEQRANAAPRLLQGFAVHEQYARWTVLDTARVELQQKLPAIEQRRDLQRSAYVAARRDRELLEEIEGRQRADHNAAAALREQKSNDELFLMRQRRR